jgi:hypothetical protein
MHACLLVSTVDSRVGLAILATQMRAERQPSDSRERSNDGS